MDFLNGNIDETIIEVMISNRLPVTSISNFHYVITSYGFEANMVEDCVYYKFSGSKFIFLILYVDDILIATNDVGLLYIGEASFVLGIKIY